MPGTVNQPINRLVEFASRDCDKGHILNRLIQSPAMAIKDGDKESR